MDIVYFFVCRSGTDLFCPKPTGMIIRLGRLTPGYFRLLQVHVFGVFFIIAVKRLYHYNDQY